MAVALKILLPEVSAAPGPERFQREIHFAARLQHPHILTVLDSGSIPSDTSEGLPDLWYTMPFVDGESLRDRLHRMGPLPLEDALRITHEEHFAQVTQFIFDVGVTVANLDHRIVVDHPKPDPEAACRQ